MKLFLKFCLMVLACIAFVALLKFSGNMYFKLAEEPVTPSYPREPIGVITLNLCKRDPEYSGFGNKPAVRLFSKAGGLSVRENKVLWNIPPCDKIMLDILEKRVVDGVEFYLVRRNMIPNIQGWQTKSFLTGEE